MYQPPFVAIGSYVRMKEQDTIGQVIRIDKNNHVLVSIRSFILHLPMQAIEVVESPWTIPQKSPPVRNTSFQIKPGGGSDTLDLHGLTQEQALLALDKFIDKALLLHHNPLKIIHGQGKGILRNAVRNYLRQHACVKKVHTQSPLYCMAGMTLVEL
ncbi:MAG TPA: Smr/MutS family protein [Amoebophilaceae bacterium]|nr:Smr/MutS family protein [Amoebophilaceae bacterium]